MYHENTFTMTFDSDEIPHEDEMPEIAATESSVAKLQHLVNISEKKTAVALVDTLKSPVKKFVSQAKWSALPSQFLSPNQPDTTILVNDTGIVGLTVYDATPFIALTYPEEESNEEFLDDSNESALNDHLVSANFLEHQQRKDVLDIGFTPSMTMQYNEVLTTVSL